MLKHQSYGLTRWAREEVMGLFSISGTLAGLSLTIATLFNIINKTGALATVSDNVLTLCALMFITCNALIFWSLRSTNTRLTRHLTRLVEVLFFLAQLMMLVSCMTIVWKSF